MKCTSRRLGIRILVCFTAFAYTEMHLSVPYRDTGKLGVLIEHILYTGLALTLPAYTKSQ